MKISTEDRTNKRKRLRRFIYLFSFIVLIGIFTFILRGPQVSDALKKLILPELEAAFGQNVIVQKIHVNIFPLFIEAKGIKVFDESGDRILSAKRVKGYVEFPGLFRKKLSLRRLLIREPDISTDRQKVSQVINHFRAYLEEERKTSLKVNVKMVEITDGTVSFRDNLTESLVGITELKGEIMLGKEMKLKLSCKKLDIEKERWPHLTGNFDTSLILRDDGIEIKKLTIGSYGSDLKASGFYSKGKGTLKGDLLLLVDSAKQIFGLRERSEGGISAKGEVRLEGISNFEFRISNFKNIFVDLKLKGDFYLQTLMEFVKAKEELQGHVEFNGELKGNLSGLSGEGTLKLKKGNLYGVEVDTLRSEVNYKEMVMRFSNIDAGLYRGSARGSLSLTLPKVESFNLALTFKSIDSKPAFLLIGWDPEISAGKVEGELVSSGKTFNPDGWFIYEAQSREQRAEGKKYPSSSTNVLDRIKTIKGFYALRGDILSLSALHGSTSSSDLTLEGHVDMTKKNLNLNMKLDTRDVSDLTLPYYRGIRGRGNFQGGVRGAFDDPELSGSFNLSDTSVEGYRVSRIVSRFSYNKNLLNVHELLLIAPEEEHRIKGRVLFPEAKKLFEFSKPVYEISATIKNADLKEAIKMVHKDAPVTGRIHADLKMGGKEKDVEIVGNTILEKAEISTIPVDTASTSFLYVKNELSLKNILIRRGASAIMAEGKISSDGKFSYKASSEKILMKDLGLEQIPLDASLNIVSEGHGTFEDPVITLNARVDGAMFKGRAIGSSSFHASIKNREITVLASFFDKKIRLKGKGHLSDPLPWSSEVDIQQARYDFIYGSILKDIPEDISLSLGGRIEMKGDRNNITASADIPHFKLGLYGYTLSNVSDIKVHMENRKLFFPSFTLRNTGSLLKLGGDMEIGKSYNLFLEGRSSLVPLKALSRKIEHLSGEVDLSFSIKGKVEKPEMSGYVNIANAALALKGYQQRIGLIDGNVSLEKDRIVIKKLSGKIGGGDIGLSGLLYLTAFKVTRFHLETKFGDITTYASKDFMVTFRGNLLYRGTPDAQSISGDIEIKSARYKEKIEWQKWLLATKSKELPKTEVSGFEKATLNIRISGDDNIYIDNNVARVTATVDIVVKGTVSRPVILGRLESKEGIFYFRNNEFKVIRASADFVDPNRINPFIDLAATTNVSNYNIKLNLEGQPDRFNLSLSSDPPMEKMDILSLLTVGHVGEQSKGVEGGVGAEEAASFLAGQIQDVIGERMKSITGFERVKIDPYVSKTTGTMEPRVTVSKRLADDRLYVTYSTSISSTEEHLLKLEYLLGRNISLVGVRDERGSMGGNIKFRFEFK